MTDAIKITIAKGGGVNPSHVTVCQQQADPEAWIVNEFQAGNQRPFNTFAMTTDRVLDMIKRDARRIG